MNLEDELRRALEREPAPDGFAHRVLERAATRRPVRRTIIPRVWLAVAAMIAIAILVVTDIRHYQTRREATARQAGRDLVIALKITSNTLHTTGRMIRRKSNGI